MGIRTDRIADGLLQTPGTVAEQNIHSIVASSNDGDIGVAITVPIPKSSVVRKSSDRYGDSLAERAVTLTEEH